MCNKAVATYPSSMQIVSKCYKSQKISDKAVDACRFVFDSVPDLYVSLKKGLIELFPKKLLCLNFVSIDRRPKNCGIKLLILICYHQNLILTGLL